MLTCIKGGRVIDPANGRDGVGDVWIRDARIVDAPPGDRRADETYDATGKIVMAGAIDIHSHIAGSNVNTARLLLPRAASVASAADAPLDIVLSTFETGCLYAAMGFTTVVEPAVAPTTRCRRISSLPTFRSSTRRRSPSSATTISCSACCDAGRAPSAVARLCGVDACDLALARHQGRSMPAARRRSRPMCARSLSTTSCRSTASSSRDIVKALQHAVHELGIPHPLHVHCNNLGIPGNAETALATIAAADGLPLHLAHLQFYGYGKEGAARLLVGGGAARRSGQRGEERDHRCRPGDVRPDRHHLVRRAAPVQRAAIAPTRRKWVIYDGDGNGGGIVPYHYRANDFYNAVQWAIGLELFLLIDDPWRVFFTTDHPNGAPFTTYPDLFALLMSRELRAQWIATLPPDAMAVTTLASITREYSLDEIAIMTRAAPAKLLGLADRGHLGPGTRADIAVYSDDADRAKMFRAAHLVFKDGELVVRDGAVTARALGPGAHRRSRSMTARSSGACGTTAAIATDCRPTSWRFRSTPSAGPIRSSRCHAPADRQRRAHRRHLRGSLPDAGDRRGHHGRQRRNGRDRRPSR